MIKHQSVPLKLLEEKDQDYIASFLDSDQKWAKVAHELSVSSQNIGWIKNRIHPRGSNTLMLLEDLSREEKSVEDLMEAVKNCNVLPVEDYLSRRYPAIKENYLRHPAHVVYATPSSSSNCSTHFTPPTFHHHPLDFAFLMLPNVLLLYCSAEAWEEASSLVQFLDSNKIVARLGVPEGERNEDLNILPHSLVTLKQFEKLKCPILVLVTPNLRKEIKNLDCCLNMQGNPGQQISGKENQTIHGSLDPPLNCKQALMLATDTNYRKKYLKNFLVVLSRNAISQNIPRWLENSKIYHWNMHRAQLLHQVCHMNTKLSRKSIY